MFFDNFSKSTSLSNFEMRIFYQINFSIFLKIQFMLIIRLIFFIVPINLVIFWVYSMHTYLERNIHLF